MRKTLKLRFPESWEGIYWRAANGHGSNSLFVSTLFDNSEKCDRKKKFQFDKQKTDFTKTTKLLTSVRQLTSCRNFRTPTVFFLRLA